LELDFVLHDQSLALVRDGLVKLGGDGVVSSLVFEDKTLVSLDASQDSGLLDTPGADELPLFLRVLLLRV
jgi:hypothetical protein